MLYRETEYYVVSEDREDFRPHVDPLHTLDLNDVWEEIDMDGIGMEVLQ